MAKYENKTHKERNRRKIISLKEVLKKKDFRRANLIRNPEKGGRPARLRRLAEQTILVRGAPFINDLSLLTVIWLKINKVVLINTPYRLK